MRLAELRRVGHWPSLAAGFLHFEISFGIWVLLGALGPFVASELSLSPAMKGLVVGTPLLAAAGFRIAVGMASDRYGPRRVGIVTMVLTGIPLAWAWVAGDTLVEVLGIGALLGIAGASFAVALPLAAAHYPPSHRGLALGIAGAGNSGTVIAALFAPRIAERIGWHATFGVALVPVALVAVAFRVLARESPQPRARRSVRQALGPLRTADAWRLCALYAVTFGCYVGLASYLPLMLVDQYGISRVSAATIAAAAAGAGSVLRPVGGALADRVHGTRVLIVVYALAAAILMTLGSGLPLAGAAGAFVVLLGVLGIGNGAVFQLVPERFPDELGVATGIIGAAGGIGGFFLPTVLGGARAVVGSEAPGLLLVAAASIVAAFGARALVARWAPTAGASRLGDEAAAA